MRARLAVAGLIVLAMTGCARERLGPPAAGTHKRAATTIRYYLDAQANDALELGVREAFQLWSDATKFHFEYGGKLRTKVARDGRDEVVMMAKWPNELPIGAAVWCQPYFDAAGNIVETDILLNAQAFAFTSQREARAGGLYIEEVLSRAIGESLGLGLDREQVGSVPERFRAAQDGEAYSPGIDPADMAAYLSLYAAE